MNVIYRVIGVTVIFMAIVVVVMFQMWATPEGLLAAGLTVVAGLELLEGT